MAVRTATLSDCDLCDFSGSIPPAIQFRMALNSQGIRFQDDGRPSLIINENPIPLGVVTTSYNIEKRLTTYNQEI